LAFLAIVIVTYALGKWISKSIGAKSRKSVLGPVDRVLGFGFGAVKGLIGASLIFLFLVMAYETAFGGKAERPEWMTVSRTYPLLNASGDALSTFIRERQESGGDSKEAP
jgi:membrane protein required for colicin V production